MLNERQRQAVHYIQGPCLVLAGAGSGKTRVITEKIAYLIKEKIYRPRQIGAVTFTNKAAREMRERVTQTMGKQHSRGLTVSTFHTLGLNIIRRELGALGLKSGFSLFDDQDSFALIKALTEDDWDGDKQLIQDCVWQIGHWKNDMLTPELAAQRAANEKQVAFAQVYQAYQRNLVACNAVDFDDLIRLPTLLLSTNPLALKRWQTKFQYLLVDEYQDTNTSQYQLVKLLVGERGRFTVVGDDDQSIYSWRGAQPQNLALLQKDFSDLKVVKLEQNYRSHGRILKAANILIENNPHVFEKKLFSDMQYGVPMRVIYGRNEEHEAERVIAEIVKQRFLKKTPYHDFAILYRGNHQARLFEKALMNNRIPYKITGGQSFFARAEVKDIMAYLRLLVNPADDTAFLRVINLPKRGIGPQTIERIGELSKQLNSSLFEAAQSPHVKTLLSPKVFNAVDQFVEMMSRLAREADHQPHAQEAVRQLLHDIAYEDWLFEQSPSAKAAEMRIKNIHELHHWVSDMLAGSAEQEPMTLEQVVSRLCLRDMMSRNEDEDNFDQVQLMTLHASKGLEFPQVFLVGMEEGLLPHQSSIDLNDVEEERRLAYVGITRAQHQLFFTMARERRQYGEVINPQASRFLHELPQDDLEWEQQQAAKSEEDREQQRSRGLEMLKNALKK
ncbi:DNA helicase Rep [Idiomarina seosinensis]|uniref:DNA helicase Rep n=1 Tax=Idiomarina seosinensis TaxID=281739 RepID=UPI00384F8537